MKREFNNVARRMMALIAMSLLLAFAACSTSSSSSPATGIVTGVVKDVNTGEPVSGAIITNGTATTVADSNGNFSLMTTAGKQTLTASAQGYTSPTRVCDVASGATTTLNWSLTSAPGEYWDYGTATPSDTLIPAANMDYVILAWNDLGMHCAQDDYSYCLILPPFNTLHVQVVKRGAAS